MINLWAKSVVKYRILVLIASLAIVVLAGMGLKQLYFESSTDIWFLKNDPVLLDYNELKDKFGSDDYLVVGVESTKENGDILNQETLVAIRKITDFLEEHVAVNKVRSINKFEYIFYKDGLLNVKTAIPYSKDYNFSQSELESIRAILKNEEIAHDLMFTKDLQNSIISARVVKQEDYTGPDNAKKDLAADFRTFIERENLDKSDVYKLHYSGSAIISESFFFYSTLDQSISYPLMMLFVLIFLFVLFRTWMGTVLPFGIMVLASIVSMGVLGYTGWSVNMLNIIIPTILTVIALGSSIHVMMGFYRGKNEGLDSKTAARKSVERYLKPCFFAFITTMFGFLALTTSNLALVVQFGLEMVIGVAAAFIFSLSTLPAILSYSRVDKSKTERLAKTGWVARAIHNWPAKVLSMRPLIVAVVTLVMLPSLYFVSKVEVDTNFVRNFKESAPVRQGLQYFDNTYKGALSLEFMLDSGKVDGVKEPAFLQRVLEFQQYVTSLEGTGRANSILNYMLKINQVLHDNDPTYFRVPETRNMVAQYLLLYSSSGPDEDLTDLMTFEGRNLRVSVFFEVAPSKVTKERVEEIERYIAANFADLNIKTSGRAVLFNNMDTYVLEGLTSSFSLALLVVALCFLVLLRSFKYGLISLIPNILPIIIAGAIMGVLGIYLDFATLLIAATTLGIAVDDSIHFMSRYVSERRANQTHDNAVTKAIRQNGPAIISTTVVLVIGFSMLMLSSFVPNIYMGFIGVVVIIFALIGDLIVLPVVIPSQGLFAQEKRPKQLKVNDQEA